MSTTPPAALLLAQAAAGEDLIVQSLWEFIQKGGMMMIPIGLCSLVAVGVIAERLISLRRRSVIPPSFRPGLEKLLKARPGDKDAAVGYCRRHESPVARVFEAGIKRMDGDPSLIEKRIEDAGAREVVRLRRRLRSLSVIASITPLLGLLGTILGMIAAFQTVAASGEALGRAEMLAEGIYEAMITTAAGLSVAIPVLVCYHWISGRIERLVSDIDWMTVRFIEEFVEGDGAARPVDRRPTADAAAHAGSPDGAAPAEIAAT